MTSLILLVALFVVLALAAARWGADTRDPDYSMRSHR
jgi:hypothetical protein